MKLEISNLTVLYDRAMKANNVSMHVNEGGNSGTCVQMVPKTTLLKAVAGLIKWEKDARCDRRG